MGTKRGEKRAKGYQVVSVTYQTEVVRMHYQSDGTIRQERRVAQNGRNPNQEAFEGAFGLYYVDREIISLRCPGSEQLTVCSGRAVKNVGRTFYRWDCVIMTVRQHATARPNDLPRLMQHLLEDEEQLFVAFEADDEYHYFLCEKRDLVLEKPKLQSRKEERTPANPKVNSAKVVSKLKN